MGEDLTAAEVTFSASVFSGEEIIIVSVDGAKESGFDDITNVDVVAAMEVSAKYYMIND